MGNFIDLTGKKYNSLIFLSRAKNVGKNTLWLVKCDCGCIKSMQPSAVIKGLVVSCGCYARKIKTTHGHSKHPLYSTWKKIIYRCDKKSDKAYKNYGARGISVSDEWRNSFLRFVDDMGNKPDGYEIDRKDNNGNYCKENCHWVTPETNSNNRRSNVFITYKDKTLTIMQWSRLTGVNRRTIIDRYNKGWSLDKVFS